MGRVAAALIAVSALALTGAWQWQSMKNNSLNKVSALDLNPATSSTPTPSSR